jgi:hypothetical protein
MDGRERMKQWMLVGCLECEDGFVTDCKIA